MRIATWNVNSIRARLPRLTAWLQKQSPDVLCIQELKCLDEQFPKEEIEALGYHAVFHGQKTYNGVAILSKTPIDDVIRGFPGDGGEARVIAATVEDIDIICVYVVNGESVGSEKYARKLDWLEKFRKYLAKRYRPDSKWLITGDFNITFDDRDVYDPGKFREKNLCSTPEREAMKKIVDCGCRDALRKHRHLQGPYTWFDFRTGGFERQQGLRIDHFLLSMPLFRNCSDVEVDMEERGEEKPSDHAPVIATLLG